MTAYLERKVPCDNDQVKACPFETLGKVQEEGKASIHWLVGHLDTLSSTQDRWASPGQYYIRVVNNKTGASDRSDAAFTILPRSVDVRVSNSDGPITVDPAQKVWMTWDSTNKTSCTAYGVSDIQQPYGGNQPQINNLPANGKREVYVWFWDPSYGTSVTVSCTGNGQMASDWVQINSKPQAAYLKVTSPNGGENIQTSAPYDITWSQTGISRVSVALYKNDMWSEWIIRDMNSAGDGKGSVQWVPKDVLAGTGQIYKIYITGQRNDGSGYVDDKSDSKFSFANGSATTSTAGTLTIGTDPSTPVYQIVSGGSTGVTVGAYRVRANGESIQLTKATLVLNFDTAQSGDVTQYYVYSGSTLLGTGVMTNGNNTAYVTFASPLVILKDGLATLTLKADIAPIGTTQPGHSGSLVKVMMTEVSGTGATSGSSIKTTQYDGGWNDYAGVRIFKSYPTVALAPLPSTGLEDGRLIRFSVTASPSGDVQVGKFSFNQSCANVSMTEGALYGYADASFSNPIPGYAAGRLAIFPGGCFSSTFNLAPVPPVSTPSPIVIPAGQTYYFEMRGTLSGVSNSSAITTALLGDKFAQNAMATGPDAFVSGGFVWSPDTLSVAAYTDKDWTNGYGVQGFSGGVVQARTRTVTNTLSLGTITATQPPSRTVNPGETQVEFTRMTLINNGTSALHLDGIALYKYGANNSAFTNAQLTMGAQKATAEFNGIGYANIYMPIDINPGQSITLNALGNMVSAFGADAGKEVGLGVAGILHTYGTSLTFTGVMPNGTTHTLAAPTFAGPVCPVYQTTACPTGTHRLDDTSTYDANRCEIPNWSCVSDGGVSAPGIKMYQSFDAAGMMGAVVMAPFNLMIDSLTDIFVMLGVGR